MKDCLFCKIINKEIPSTKVFENDNVYGFVDITPQAKDHYLFVHKKHSTNINQISEEDASQFKDIFQAIKEFTQSNQLEEKGFRVVTNIGKDGGQTVFHTHFHVLGGEQLRGFGN